MNQQLRLLIGGNPTGNTNRLLLCVSSDSCLEIPGIFLFIRSYNPVPTGLIPTLPLANQEKRHPYACKIACYDFFPENAPAHGSQYKQGTQEFSLQVGDLSRFFFLYVAGSPLGAHDFDLPLRRRDTYNLFTFLNCIRQLVHLLLPIPTV